MKFLVAVVLVIVSMAAAEPPSRRVVFQKQTAPAAPPYQPAGWRPNGPAFNPTLRAQKQEQAPPEPAPSYGPPPSVSYGPPQNEVTTSETPTTTEEPVEETTLELQAESIQLPSRNEIIKSEKLQEDPKTNVEDVYVVVPQGQRFIYSAPFRVLKAAAIVEAKDAKKDVEIIKEPTLAPVQAIPALAKIQLPALAKIQLPALAKIQLPAPVVPKYSQIPQLVKLQNIQAIPTAQYATTFSQTSVYTPYSSSFVQIFQ